METKKPIFKIKCSKARKEAILMLKPNLLEHNKWHSWSKKSEGISFESPKKAGTGDGELKFATEHNIKPLGQNMTYDFIIAGKKYECKKLDCDGSFNLGVEVLHQYSAFKMTITLILDKIKELNTRLDYEPLKEIHTNFMQVPKGGKFNVYTGTQRTELSKTNLTTLTNNINKLKEIVEAITPLKKHIIVNEIEQDVSHYRLLQLLDLSNDEIRTRLGTKIYTNEVIYDSFKKHLKLFNETTAQNYLTNIVRNYFSDKTLLIVDKKKGYYITDNISKITCIRITRGNVRGIYNPT